MPSESVDVNCLVSHTWMAVHTPNATPRTHTNSNCPPSESLARLDWGREEVVEEDCT